MINEFFIIFKDSDKWITKLLPKGFRHLTLYAVDNSNLILFDLRTSKMEVSIIPGIDPKNIPNIVSTAYKDCKIIHIKMSQHSQSSGLHRIIFNSCVGMTKYIVGLNCSSITPKQLFNKLTSCNIKSLGIEFLKVKDGDKEWEC
jgi:hypothetical protein